MNETTERLLCRAKRVDNGEWVSGYYVKHGDCGTIYTGTTIDRHHINEYGLPCVTAEKHYVDPSTVCQYTGLTDKNGVKIWEGDILRFKSVNADVLAKVVYKTNKIGFVGCFVWKEIKNGFKRLFDEQNITLIEVIGNIFDNPELLKGGAEG